MRFGFGVVTTLLGVGTFYKAARFGTTGFFAIFGVVTTLLGVGWFCKAARFGTIGFFAIFVY